MVLLKVFVLILFSLSFPAIATEKVRLQLKWSHQFQFAGYYAAQKQGYYKEAGLEVEIIEAKTGDDPTAIVLMGNAEYGVGNNSLLLLRSKGDPLVVLAVIFQHSPYALLTLQHNSAQNIHDLANKNLMIEPLADELIAYLNHEGMPLNKFKLIDYRHNIQDFISGKVDAISSYVTDEPYILEKNGIPYYSYSPRSVGIDFYGDNLFTTEHEIKFHPERTRKFREASLKGWLYAMSHQDEIIDYILNKYPGRKERDFLAFEAEKMQQLIHPELIDIGYMLPGRWQHIAETYVNLGMLPQDYSMDGFLYESEVKHDYFWFYLITGIAVLVVFIAILVNLSFAKLNKKLINLLHLKSQFANIGESINNISHQWKQPLNELGIQLMLIERTLENEPITKKEKDQIKRITHKSHGILEFMANTVDVFGHLLKTRQRTSAFYPKTIIKELFQLIGDNFKINKIVITSELHNDIQLNGNPTELAHVILSILNNARDIFRERDTPSPRIHFLLYKQSNIVHIEIMDNAGGIKVNPIDKIFNLGFSNKKSDDSGVGLYIARQLIEKNFNGSIRAENIDSGSVFKITIPVT